MGNLLNMSGGSLLGKGLPYDAEIEYLESSGTQYIDTGCKKTSNTKCIIEVAIDSNFIRYQSMILGATIGWNAYSLAAYSKTIIRFGVYSTYRNTNLVWGNTFHRIEYGLGALIIDENTPISYTEVSNNLNIYLFARSEENKVSIGNYIKIKSAQVIGNNNNILRYFIPVRIGQTGYLYDKVSGQLFGNAGTGDFILGNDI